MAVIERTSHEGERPMSNANDNVTANNFWKNQILVFINKMQIKYSSRLNVVPFHSSQLKSVGCNVSSSVLLCIPSMDDFCLFMFLPSLLSVAAGGTLRLAECRSQLVANHKASDYGGLLDIYLVCVPSCCSGWLIGLKSDTRQSRRLCWEVCCRSTRVVGKLGKVQKTLGISTCIVLNTGLLHQNSIIKPNEGK